MTRTRPQPRRAGTIVVGVVLLVMGAASGYTGWFVLFGASWAHRPLEMTITGALAAAFGCFVGVRGLAMIALGLRRPPTSPLPEARLRTREPKSPSLPR